ncbi:MAG: SWIM zinc finger family protein, partial [Polyangiaceae bacterium]
MPHSGRLPSIPLDRIDPRLLDKLERRLRSIEPVFASRGRRYALDGRVERVTVEDRNEVSAVVQGSQPYFVRIADTSNDLATACSCPAWDRMGSCKHIAAVLFALREGRSETRYKNRDKEDEPVTRFLSELGNVTIEELADAIGRHAGTAIEIPFEPWRRAHEWWQQTKRRSEPRTLLFRELVATWVPKLEADYAKLRAWMPPPRRGQAQNDFEAFRDAIAGEARRMRGGALSRMLPGPFDEGAARFVFTYKSEHRVLEIAERTVRGRSAHRLLLEIPDRPDAGIKIPSHSQWMLPSLWDLFALRGLLLALDERSDPTILALARDLERPRWERMLEATRTKDRPFASRGEDTEIAFRITQSYQPDAIT